MKLFNNGIYGRSNKRMDKHLFSSCIGNASDRRGEAIASLKEN